MGLKTVKILCFYMYYCLIYVKSQTTYDYLSNFFQEELNKKPKSMIFTANVCCGCLDKITHEGFLFIEDTLNKYKVKYLKYIQSPVKVKILMNEIFEDNNVKDIFKIFGKYHDSIIWEMNNIENILTDTIIENGKKIFSTISSSGIVKYIKVYYNNKTTTSIIDQVSYNINKKIFEKCYYYWLLHSAINNYISDSFRRKHNINKKK